jgi:hypothetical protein
VLGREVGDGQQRVPVRCAFGCMHLVALHSPAALLSILRQHDGIGHTQLRELAVKVEAKGPGFPTVQDFPS